MSSQQWPAYQQQLLRKTENENFRIKQNMTQEEKEKYLSLWMTEVEIAGDLPPDYPDQLCDAIAENKTLILAQK